MATAILRHPRLGEIRGKVGDKVVQFLGIKYATVKDRFAEAEIIDSYGGHVDATTYGPTAAYPKEGFFAELEHIQHSLPLPDFTVSEQDGLNLNITVPVDHVASASSGARLPVFLFIHGGGLGVGSNSWPQLDQARLVKLSVELQMPVIGININYRLGVPGTLTSEELRNAGYKPNNFLRDQRTALQWVKKNIGGFGGDPDNVTVSGESSGSASAAFHLHSHEPLFNRIICMSGTPLLSKPFSADAHEAAYQSFLKAFNLDSLPVPERIEKLLAIPTEEIIYKVPKDVPISPMIDGELIPAALTFENVASCFEDPKKTFPGGTWCKEFIIGDCQFDGSIMGLIFPHLQTNAAERFRTAVSKTLADHPDSRDAFLAAYGVTDKSSDEEAYRSSLRFVTDIMFHAPTITMAKAWPQHGSVYVYYFNEGNPWDGPFKGEATHILDVAYLFQNFNEFMSPTQQSLARKFARDFIAFANGKKSWGPFTNENQSVMVYGPSTAPTGQHTQFVENATTQSVGRRDIIFTLADSLGMNTLSKLWGTFVAGS